MQRESLQEEGGDSGNYERRVCAEALLADSTFPSLAAVRGSMMDPATPLFPCPRIPRPATTSSRSHRVRARHKRRDQLWQTACLFFDALTSLDTGMVVSRTQRQQDRASHSSHSISLTAAQQRMQSICLREASRLELVRREETRPGGSSLTGAQCTSTLLKTDASDRYSVAASPSTPQVALRAAFLDEPTTDQTVCMLSALSPEEAAYYAEETNVVDIVGKSHATFEDLERQYGFVGGAYSEYVDYFLRDDLPKSMWQFTADPTEVKATAGFSAVMTE